jgi:hypothetical protein
MNQRHDLPSPAHEDDPDIAQFQSLLAPYAYSPPSEVPAFAPRPRRIPRTLAWAAAACALLALSVATHLAWRLAWPEAEAWRLQAHGGDARLDGRPITDRASLHVGGELRTGHDAQVDLDIARIGTARLGPGSRLRLETTRGGEHRLRLLEGELWTRVWAPPRHFGLHLPGVEAMDMGCEFTARSDADGNGELHVRSGWVQVQARGREVMVPQGARVTLVAGRGAGTPHDVHTSPAFLAAIGVIDAGDPSVAPTAAQLEPLLTHARAQDAISLLTLLSQHPELARGPLFDWLARALPTAAPVRRENVLNRPAQALEPWWRALPYPQAKRWWLHWPDALPGDPPAAG